MYILLLVYKEGCYITICLYTHRISLLAASASGEQAWGIGRGGGVRHERPGWNGERWRHLPNLFCLLLPAGQTRKETLGFDEKIWINYLVHSLSFLCNLFKIETIGPFWLAGPGKDSHVSPHRDTVSGTESPFGPELPPSPLSYCYQNLARPEFLIRRNTWAGGGGWLLYGRG